MSTETKATPTEGPWECEAIPAEAYTDPDMQIDEDDLFWIVDAQAACEVIGTVGKVSHGDAYANARLIATAPDMELLLRALRCGVASWYAPTAEFRFQGLMFSTFDNNWSRLCETVGRQRLQDAISRAEGKKGR